MPHSTTVELITIQRAHGKVLSTTVELITRHRGANHYPACHHSTTVELISRCSAAAGRRFSCTSRTLLALVAELRCLVGESKASALRCLSAVKGNISCSICGSYRLTHFWSEDHRSVFLPHPVDDLMVTHGPHGCVGKSRVSEAAAISAPTAAPCRTHILCKGTVLRTAHHAPRGTFFGTLRAIMLEGKQEVGLVLEPKRVTEW